MKKSRKIMFNTQTAEVWKVKIDVRGSFWLKHKSVGREKKKLIKMNLCKTYIYLATKISKSTEFCYQFCVSWLSYTWKIKQLPNLYNCAQPPTCQWSIRRSDQIAHLVMLSGHRVKYLSIKNEHLFASNLNWIFDSVYLRLYCNIGLVGNRSKLAPN